MKSWQDFKDNNQYIASMCLPLGFCLAVKLLPFYCLVDCSLIFMYEISELTALSTDY